jgi:hypothetical protein
VCDEVIAAQPTRTFSWALARSPAKAAKMTAEKTATKTFPHQFQLLSFKNNLLGPSTTW